MQMFLGSENLVVLIYSKLHSKSFDYHLYKLLILIKYLLRVKLSLRRRKYSGISHCLFCFFYMEACTRTNRITSLWELRHFCCATSPLAQFGCLKVKSEIEGTFSHVYNSYVTTAGGKYGNLSCNISNTRDTRGERDRWPLTGACPAHNKQLGMQRNTTVLSDFFCMCVMAFLPWRDIGDNCKQYCIQKQSREKLTLGRLRKVLLHFFLSVLVFFIV